MTRNKALIIYPCSYLLLFSPKYRSVYPSSIIFLLPKLLPITFLIPQVKWWHILLVFVYLWSLYSTFFFESYFQCIDSMLSFFFSFSTLKIALHCLLTFIVSDEKYAVILNLCSSVNNLSSFTPFFLDFSLCHCF